MRDNIFKMHFDLLNLSHHPYQRIMAYLEWCFREIDFRNKIVLDIGGGNGIHSFYARYKGAKRSVNLEPFSAGSTEFNFDSMNIKDKLYIEVLDKPIQEFKSKERFDVIIMHDSINHLNESIFEGIHLSEKKFNSYKKIMNSVVSFLNPSGVIIISDCARRNFWGDIGLKSPFAPSIDWHLHQSPKLVLKLFEDHRLKANLRWSPFKRFGFFGRLISRLGFLPSYFMQSHFNLILKFE